MELIRGIIQVLERISSFSLPKQSEVDSTVYKRRCLDSTLVAIVDTETTGLGDLDEPISIGAVLLDVSGKRGEVIVEVDSFHGFREPGVRMTPSAQQIHGVASEDLVGERLDLVHLRNMLDSAQLIVSHNAKFDRRMLCVVLPHLRDARWACSIHTLKYDWAKLGDGRRSLDALCAALEIERPTPHNALSDCYSLLSVLKTTAGTRARTRMARLIRNPWAPAP
jgi:DNA polymerase-3 subunit epsilon